LTNAALFSERKDNVGNRLFQIFSLFKGWVLLKNNLLPLLHSILMHPNPIYCLIYGHNQYEIVVDALILRLKLTFNLKTLIL